MPYEISVGKKYEKDGYHVFYSGIVYEKHDMGIDSVAYNDKECILIQCKWSNLSYDNSNLCSDEINKIENNLKRAKKRLEERNVNRNIKLHVCVNKDNTSYYHDCFANKGLLLRAYYCIDGEQNVTEESIRSIRIQCKKNDVGLYDRIVELLDEQENESNDLNKKGSTTISNVGDGVEIEPEEKPIKVKKKHSVLLILIIIVLAIGAFHYFTHRTVIIAPYSGEKYHNTEDCEGLEKAHYQKEMTWIQAHNKGYTPCKLCKHIWDY